MNIIRVERHCLRGGECVNKGAAKELVAAINNKDAWLDFSNIIIANAVFCDELFDRLLDARTLHDLFVGLLQVDKNVREDIRRSLVFLRARRGLPNAARLVVNDGEYSLIGEVQPKVYKAWHTVKQQGSLTAVDYRDMDGREHAIAAYSTYLNAAYNASLLVRSAKRTSAGYVYRLPTVEDM